MDEGSKYNKWLKESQELAKAQGLSFSQAYLRKAEREYRKIEKHIPYLWKAIMGKKYLLPEYRQLDYVNQDVYSYLILDSLVAAGKGKFRDIAEDRVTSTQYVSFLRAIECDRPIYWLEKELSRPMVKTKLPDDFMISDIHWRWPCFRVYLPKGLLTIEIDGQVNTMVYLDILMVKGGVKYFIPKELEKDLWELGAYVNPGFENNVDGMAVNGILDLDGSAGAIGYSGVTPLDNMSVARLMSEKTYDLNPSFISNKQDDQLVHQMLQVGLNLIIFLSSYPLEYDVNPRSAMVRKERKEGDRTMPGLYKAKFVGMSRLRPKHTPGEAYEPHASYEQMAQWRAGHWKRVWFGPKKGQSRLQWIGLYHTGTEEEAGPKPENKPE